MARIAVAVSGGADSLFALLTLRDAGHEVLALHGRFLPPAFDAGSAEAAANVAVAATTTTATLADTAADTAADAGAVDTEAADASVMSADRAEVAAIAPAAANEHAGATENMLLAQDAEAPRQDPVPALREACAALGIPLHLFDLADIFDAQVVAPFVRTYAAGRTPNPCALCNRHVKFGALLDAALRLGAESLATGHYATLLDHPRHGRILGKAADQTKDQSYFLALTPLERLQRALFPLATVRKKDAVAALAARGIAVPLPQESQEICFVPQDRYRPFLEAQSALRGIPLSGPGPMLLYAGTERERQVGWHNGLWQYTEGQRRGLGIAHSEPLYVLGKDHTRNALLLAEHGALHMSRCRVAAVNALVAQQHWPPTLFARVRYRQQPARAIVHPVADAEGQMWDILFDAPQAPTAPGQIAAIYDAEGTVLGGGIIQSTGQ